MSDTKTDRLQQIVDEYAAALGVPAGRVEWSLPVLAPSIRLADLLAVPSPAELRGAGCHPASVPLVGALLAGMAEQTRGMFLSMSADRVDAAPDWLAAAAFGPPLADIVRAALAAALFGWLP